MILYVEGENTIIFDVNEIEIAGNRQLHIETTRGVRHITLPYNGNTTAKDVLETLYRDGKAIIYATVSKPYKHNED